MKNRAGIALVVSMLVVSSFASAASKSAQPAYDFKARMDALFDAWGSLDPAQAAPFYAKDADLDFYDIAPMKYTGWAEYAEGVKKEFAPFASAKWTLGPYVRIRSSGNIAWATATWHGELLKKDGSKQALDGRYTCVWEKRGNEWLVVHEHMSVPLAPAQQ